MNHFQLQYHGTLVCHGQSTGVAQEFGGRSCTVLIGPVGEVSIPLAAWFAMSISKNLIVHLDNFSVLSMWHEMKRLTILWRIFLKRHDFGHSCYNELKAMIYPAIFVFCRELVRYVS